ncbi:MAG: UvrD-helicase domain-containing protein [Bacteroidales bacterium]|nr:UvrD-helicase domain-containing protein [Bacteroidales bacterium]
MSIAADADQQAVIDISGGRHLVLAPPGCGKTFILAERVIQAHARGVEYADMLCLTFTNRASRGMRERISERTHNPVPGDLFVGNVHRFCSNYLFDQKKVPQNSAVIDDMDSESIIANLARLNPLENNGRYSGDIVDLQHALSQRDAGMPRRLIVHADRLGEADKPEGQHKTKLARLYAEYKDADCLLDFEDLLEKTYLYAQQDETRHRYRWIQIDEVQDLNFLQLAIVDLFATDDATIVYLGDEQQAIFSFVGARLEALDYLRKLCSPNLHHLGKNHRSPRYLLEVFNQYAAGQLGIDAALLPTTDDTRTAQPQDCCLFRACYHGLGQMHEKESLRCGYDGKACTLCRRAVADEYRLAVGVARRYAELEPDGKVAVIVPTNADADRISKEFGDTPHFKISGRDIFSTPTVQLLLAHLNVVANETCFIAWAKLLYHLHIFREYAAARNLMRELRSRAISPTDLLLYDGSSYLQQFVEVLDGEEIVLFDTETTGLDVFDDDIIQIAAVKVCKGCYVEGSDFEIILETTKEIPPIVGGHDNPMLTVYLNSERVSRAEGLQRFLDYCEGHVLIGHNVEFDYHILDSNVRRTLSKSLGHRQRFDTLKIARLVEPRLRVYKLERLLETLHLEGTNSHNAIDDVKATLSLLSYCRRRCNDYLPLQYDLLSRSEVRRMAARFREVYGDLFMHTFNRQYIEAGPMGDTPALVDELQYVYGQLLAAGVVEPAPKWQHIVDYLAMDVIDLRQAPMLRQQLDRYLGDINTTREADLCDSVSMRTRSSERFFIATAHKAKGLEFESVVVFNAVEGSYPYYYNIKNNDQEHIDEDARRLYVALSRAKKHLCVTYSHVNSRGFPNKITPFMKPIVDCFTFFAFDPQEGKVVPVKNTPLSN